MSQVSIIPGNLFASIKSSPPITRNLGRFIQPFCISSFGIILFLILWQGAANRIETSLGQFPGPVQVWEQSLNLVDDYQRERQREAAFYQRQQERNLARLRENPETQTRQRVYTGQATFPSQIITSLYTVSVGFLLASIIAIPLGICCGLSDFLYNAINPVIQVFKPVSPLAWLPLVTMVVSATYTSEDPVFAKSFLNSAFTVALCSLWPTLINTSLGVASIDRDLVNVSRVIQLPTWKYVQKIVLPSAVPLIFTGLRLSLATGWMVLIAAEMLAQNPGLGKFIWDEFQNGSSDSLGRIMVAVVVIGFIGFLLDRMMLLLQRKISWDKQITLR